jgi:hypothetical protein
MREVKGGRVKYVLHGPFELKLANTSSLVEASFADFWGRKQEQTLAKAVGVYVWIRDANGDRLPWNVGLTDKGFEKRFKQKKVIFADFANEHPAEKVVQVYLLVLSTKGNKLRRPSKGEIASNEWLEKVLIGAAIAVNPEVRNTASSKYFRNAEVEGFMNDGASSRSAKAQAFNKIFQPVSKKEK